MRGLISSLAFVTLALLALNPFVVVEIERALSARGVTSLELPKAFIPDGASDLPQIANIRSVKRGDVWIGETPCGTEIFAAPDRLPGLGSRRNGGRLTDPIKTLAGPLFKGAQTYNYIGQNGIMLRLVEPEVTTYAVSGQNFRAAQNDIHTRRPLQSDIVSETEVPQNDAPEGNRVTLAHILSPTLFSYRFSRLSQQWRSANFHLLTDQTVLTSAHQITLPRWTEYEDANANDQRKWDDLLCSAAHHELGHLRIRLDILAETLNGYTLLESGTREGLTDAVTAYRQQISDRIEARQDAYHLYNGGGTRRGMIELPYAEMPFPWLDAPIPETN